MMRDGCWKRSSAKHKRVQHTEQGSGNVFTDLGFADAAGHRAKAELVRKLTAVMAEKSVSQRVTAGIVGVSQPAFSRLLGGRFREVSIEQLIRMLRRLDCYLEIKTQHGQVIHDE